MSTTDTTPLATASIEIAAPAVDVYDLISDPVAMGEINVETTTLSYRKGTPGAVGAVFSGRNRNGIHRWSTTCTVTDAAPPTKFAFDVTSFGIAVSRWVYAIEPLDDHRCRVTESAYDRRPGWFKRPGGWATGVADRASHNGANIAATLERLKARAEA